MASKIYFFFFMIILFCNISTKAHVLPNFTTILVFGDSTVDTGNNNHILTTSRGDHLPYGQDYPHHIPTGRFSNGKLVPDFLANSLHLKKNGVPPYLQPKLSKNELLTGVCFASGGTGFDEATSRISQAISMKKQLDYFKEYLKKINDIVGGNNTSEVDKIVNGALVLVSAGANDFIFNFYDLPTRSFEFSLSDYQDFLLGKVRCFVKELYDLGARNIIVNGLPPIGCLPIQITTKSLFIRNCINQENLDSKMYNQKLKDLLRQLQEDLPGSKIIYIDTYEFLMDLIKRPRIHGFRETKRGCCGSGLLESGPFCTSLSIVCPDPSRFIFFDSIHPTESTYEKAAHYMLNQLPKFFSS